MAKKKLTEKDYWAQQIIRAQQDGKDYLFALVRRRYAEDDIESVGPGEYIGVEHQKNFPKVNDTDPDSTTFGQRIDKPNAEPTGIRLKYQDEFNAKNIEKYKSMSAVTTFGTTQHIYKFKQINITADKLNEFWTEKQDDIYDKYILKENKIVIKNETNKPDNRRKTTK